MSYFNTKPVGSSRGINFDMFQPGTSNPMIPQELYRPEAAGPRFLSTDGLEVATRFFEDMPKAIILIGAVIGVAAVAAYMATGAGPQESRPF